MAGSLDRKVVFHKVFGCGEIILNEHGIVTVQFKDKPRRFEYPKAFAKQYLATEDAELEAQIQSDIKLHQDELSMRILSIMDSSKNSQMAPPPPSKKIERSNVAFKCNYCDGGNESGAVGFNGVCSKENIEYNIRKACRIWCASADCPCKHYLDGKISEEELRDSTSKGVLVCYESTMLKDWKAFAGIYQNGENKGKPMKLLKVQKNSLAVLTTRKPNCKDSERFIFAAFLVDEVFSGDTKEEGYVIADSNWKIALNSEEARKMQFWNYYANENAPETLLMGSGLHRYLSDDQAVQILRDIIKVKTTQSEKEYAQNFLNHFCTINGIDESSVPSPNGALMRSD